SHQGMPADSKRVKRPTATVCNGGYRGWYAPQIIRVPNGFCGVLSLGYQFRQPEPDASEMATRQFGSHPEMLADCKRVNRSTGPPSTNRDVRRTGCVSRRVGADTHTAVHATGSPGPDPRRSCSSRSRITFS